MEHFGQKSKTIKITEILEDEVIQHIVPSSRLTDGASGKRKSRGQDVDYTASFNMKTSNDDNVEVDESDQMNCFSGTSMDAVEDDSVYGEDLFKFRTPKKSGQMAVRAEDCVSPKISAKASPKGSPRSPKVRTPKRGKDGTPTPKSPLAAHKKVNGEAALTPMKSHGVAAVREHQRMESSTPYRLRKRNMEDNDDKDSSSDDSIDGSEEEEEDEEEKDVKSRRANGHSNGEMNMMASAETYFDLHAMAPVTSDRTLSNLEGPRMDVDAVREALKNVEVGHKREIKALREKHHKLFPRWMLNMCYGYNVLLYGLGSKRSLLEEFRTQHLVKYSHLVVNGYFPSLTIKHILNSITEELLDEQKGFSSLNAQVNFIKEAYRNKDEDFFLIIHNIDGVLLRSEKTQNVLSQLAQVEGFHIIASIDHINSAFLWDQNKYVRLKWLWYDMTTFEAYESENAYENSLMVQQSGALALSSILHVMHSLTPNARRVFLILARHQLEAADNVNYIGMSFQSLYQQCREDFLVNSDLTLQAQLVEFRDHRLVRSKKNYEGVEHLQIPVDNATLTEFLQEYKDAR